jgi:hypothetical protein
LTRIFTKAAKPFKTDGTEIVALHRELGQFEEAKESQSFPNF